MSEAAGRVRLPPKLAERYTVLEVLAAGPAEAQRLRVADRGTGRRRTLSIHRADVEIDHAALDRLQAAPPPGVIELVEHGTDDGRDHLVVDALDTPDLRSRVAQGAFDAAALPAVVAGVVAGLEQLHGRGLVHRSLSADRVLLTSARPVGVVLDGISRVTTAGGGSPPPTGELWAAAPESLTGEVGPAGDCWALGVLLVEVLCARHPLAGIPEASLDLHLFAETWPVAPALVEDPVWRTVVAGLVRRDPTERWDLARVRAWLDDHEQPAAGGVRVGGRRLSTRSALAQALVERWEVGLERLAAGPLEVEQLVDVSRPDVLAARLADVAGSRWDEHGRLLRTALLLDPALPPVFRGVPVTPEGLGALAAEVVREGPGSPSYELLDSLQEQRAVDAVVERSGDEVISRLRDVWTTARREFAELLVAAEAPPDLLTRETRVVADAWLLHLHTDASARDRLRARLAEVPGGGRLPRWFRAARQPGSTPAQLAAASLLTSRVRAERTGPSTRPASAPRPANAEPAPATAGGAWQLRWIVPGAAALLVAAAALRWPAVTAALTLAVLVVDRVVSWLADPFLRLVGGWPPRIRGWAVAWLPLRLVGIVLRAPWRIVIDLLVLVASVVLVDRGLRLLPAELTSDPEQFVARWMVPVWSAGAVWLAAAQRRRPPRLRGTAAAASLLRAAPLALRALLVAAAVVAMGVALRAPAADPWSPYADHWEAMARLVPVERWSDWLAEQGQARAGRPPAAQDVAPGPRPQAGEPVLQVRVVAEAGLHVRAGAGTAHEVVTTLPPGAVIETTGTVRAVDDTAWMELVLDDGTRGWASGRYLEPTAP